MTIMTAENTEIYQIPEQVILKLAKSELTVFLALVYMQRNNMVTSHAAVAEVAGINKSTTAQALIRLRSRKWLTWKRPTEREIGVSGSVPHVYELFWDGEPV